MRVSMRPSRLEALALVGPTFEFRLAYGRLP